MEDIKHSLLPLLSASSALKFGEFTLKSGRVSPYFFNSSFLYTATLHNAVCRAYASLLCAPPFTSISPFSDSNNHDDTDSSRAATPVPNYDILFGPAYKGIALAGSILPLLLLSQQGNQQQQSSQTTAPSPLQFSQISYAYNRKEAKLHGEGGNLVGAPVRGRRVVVIDDVITAGTAIREAVHLIRNEGGIVVGVIVLLDRQEKFSDDEPRSALRIVSEELGVPVHAVIELSDLIEAMEEGRMPGAGKEELRRMKDYRNRYQSQG